MQFINSLSKSSMWKINMDKNGKKKIIRHDSVHITKTNKMMEEYLERVIRGEAQLSKALKRKSVKARKRKKIND